MIRGNMVLITEDENLQRHYYRSTEFNGGMDVAQHGLEIIDKYQSGDIKGVEDFYSFIDQFNKEHHQYDNGPLYDEVVLEEYNGECRYTKQFACTECPYSYYPKGNKSCTYSIDFHGVTNLFDVSSYPYHSDYSYWLNLTEDDIEVLATNGIVQIVSGGGAVFHYGEFLETELDSGMIDAEDSYDFEDEAFAARLVKEYDLTKEEAEEVIEAGLKEIAAVYDDIEEFGRAEADSYGIESWIQDYMDMEAFGRDRLEADAIYELESGRIIAAY